VSKEAEREYFRRIGDAGIAHSLGKPFSDSTGPRLLIEIGAVLSLLPPPPGRLIDLGCGTGWTSSFFARCGYDVLGLDLSPEAVDAARHEFVLPNLEFEVHDYEDEWNSADFDGAVFFDSLHHAADERSALRTAHAALRVGGACVVCEPGRGHATSATSVEASEGFGVRERDMPPQLVIDAALAVGFSRAEVFCHPHELHRHLYAPRTGSGLRERLLRTRFGQSVRLFRASQANRRTWGLVRLTK
jgi:SAM-dependent methyltransferase